MSKKEKTNVVNKRTPKTFTKSVKRLTLHSKIDSLTKTIAADKAARKKSYEDKKAKLYNTAKVGLIGAGMAGTGILVDKVRRSLLEG